MITLYGLCAFPIRMCIAGEAHLHFRWGKSPFSVRMCILGESHLLSRWGCAFPASHIAIPSGDVHSIVIHPHQECKPTPWMGRCLTGNAYPHQECLLFIQGDSMETSRKLKLELLMICLLHTEKAWVYVSQLQKKKNIEESRFADYSEWRRLKRVSVQNYGNRALCFSSCASMKNLCTEKVFEIWFKLSNIYIL